MQIKYENIVELYSRLDSSILFTLVRLGYESLRAKFSNYEIVLFSVWTLIIATCAQIITSDKSSIVLSVILTISSSLFSQAIVKSVTENTLLFQNNSFYPRYLIDFVGITAVLLFVASTPNYIQSLPYVNRSVTLILYMYTDAMGILLQDIGAQKVILAVAIFLYVLLVRFTDTLHNLPILLYCVKALSMVSINTILSTISQQQNSQFDNATQSVLIIIVLFIIDSLCSLTNKLEEGKGFAVWKGAQLLFLMYTQQHISQNATIFLCIIIFISSVMNLLPRNTLVQLIMLITVNVLLDAFTKNLNQDTESELFVLFIGVLILHLIPEFIDTKNKDNKSNKH